MLFVSRLHAEKKPGVMAGFFSALTAISVVFYIKNSGGAGTELPFNLLALLLTGCSFIWYAYRRENISRMYYQNVLLLLGTGAVALPWLLDIKVSQGVILIFIAFFAWQMLARQYINQHYRRYILWVVFLLALSQAIVCAIQSFRPDLAGQLFEYVWLKNGGRPYGIFQQINVVASFIASGLGCGFLLLATEKTSYKFAFILAGLGALAFILGINQSRVGELGAGVVLSGITFALRKQAPAWRLCLAWGMILLTFFAGAWCASHVHFMIEGKEYSLAREFSSSNYARWNLIKITLDMIAIKPWFGWGYGNFEHAFSRYVIAHQEVNFNLSDTNFTHPHNELLYAWFQGGILALAGMLLLFAGWVKIVIDGFRHSQLSGAYALLILPLLTHLNTEYPFYQSFIHFALFVVLLRIGVVDKACSDMATTSSSSIATRAMYGVTGIALLIFSVAGLVAGQQLTKYERSELQNYPATEPWYFKTQHERAYFDGMVALLMDYNRTKNTDDLNMFMRQAEDYSRYHNHKLVLFNMAVIAHNQGDDVKADEIMALYKALFLSKP